MKALKEVANDCQRFVDAGYERLFKPGDNVGAMTEEVFARWQELGKQDAPANSAPNVTVKTN